MSTPAHEGPRSVHRVWLISLALLAAVLSAAAHAAAQIEILDTYPQLDPDAQGDEVVLNRHQTFYVHLRYSTDRPTRIWVRPYLHGEPARAGSNGSYTYTGSGEALGWFFLMPNQGRVDEIRVLTDAGSRDGTAVLSLPANISSSEREDREGSEPEWVNRLRALDDQRQRQAYQQSMNQPVSPVTSALAGLAVMSMLGLGVCGFVLPVVALRRWQGGWRTAAAVPIGIMSFVLLRLIIDLSRDPTSHNLWPFEMLMAGGLSLVMMAVFWLLRRASGANR